MLSEKIKKILIVIGLGFLMTSAFFVRLENFDKSKAWSIDEMVYYRLGHQITKGLQHYHSIPYGKELMAKGRELPDYFLRPLFKHPPLFSLFVASSIEIFGRGLRSGLYVSLFFGIMMIPLTYGLGTLVFNRKVGILSALIFTADPMSTICAQKVWMETTIAFFSVLAIYWFIKGIKRNKSNYFTLSGIASGLGALTKYTGGLPTIIFILYAAFYQRDLFRNKRFIGSLCLPLLMLLPWLAWNFNVYGIDYLSMQVKLHSNPAHSTQLLRNIFLYLLLGVVVLRICWKLKNDLLPKFFSSRKTSGYAGYIIAAILFVAIFHKSFIQSFQFNHLPLTSWAGATFYGSPPYLLCHAAF